MPPSAPGVPRSRGPPHSVSTRGALRPAYPLAFACGFADHAHTAGAARTSGRRELILLNLTRAQLRQRVHPGLALARADDGAVALVGGVGRVERLADRRPGRAV